MEYQKSINVEGKSYTVIKFTGSKSIRLLTRIFKLVGEPIVGLSVLAFDKKSQDKELDMSLVQTLTGALFQKLDEDGVERLVKDILENTMDGNLSVTKDFDTRFQGQPMLIFKLLWESLEVQYGDFLGALGGLSKFAKGIKLPQ